MRELVGYTDFLILATARNERLAKAIHDDVYHQLKREACCRAGPRASRRRAGSCSTTSTACSTCSSPRRGSTTGSSSSGARLSRSSCSARPLRPPPHLACGHLRACVQENPPGLQAGRSRRGGREAGVRDRRTGRGDRVPVEGACGFARADRGARTGGEHAVGAGGGARARVAGATGRAREGARRSRIGRLSRWGRSPRSLRWCAARRGQATRIRLKALRDAAEVTDRITELARRPGEARERLLDALGEAIRRLGADGELGTVQASNGHRPEVDAGDLFQGLIEVEVGPLSDLRSLSGSRTRRTGSARRARSRSSGSQRGGRRSR